MTARYPRCVVATGTPAEAQAQIESRICGGDKCLDEPEVAVVADGERQVWCWTCGLGATIRARIEERKHIRLETLP